MFVLETVAAYLVVANYEGLTNSYMSNEERKKIDPSSKEWYNRVAGSKIQIIGWSLYVAILWLVKFSLAIFYSRLTCASHVPKRASKNEMLIKLQNWPSKPPYPCSDRLCRFSCDLDCNAVVSASIMPTFPCILADLPKSWR